MIYVEVNIPLRNKDKSVTNIIECDSQAELFRKIGDLKNTYGNISHKILTVEEFLQRSR